MIPTYDTLLRESGKNRWFEVTRKTWHRHGMFLDYFEVGGIEFDGQTCTAQIEYRYHFWAFDDDEDDLNIKIELVNSDGRRVRDVHGSLSKRRGVEMGWSSSGGCDPAYAREFCNLLTAGADLIEEFASYFETDQ